MKSPNTWPLCALGDRQRIARTHRMGGMFCADGDRLDQELAEARQVFDMAETRRHAGTSPIEAFKEDADASEKLVFARFAFVNHKAGCKVCVSDRAPRYAGMVGL
jgi:hypothetical protein